MIRRGLVISAGFALLLPILSACGEAPEGGNVTIAEAGGLVTFKGAPLADASVTFIPENGPVAIGTTDLSGKFKLATGLRSGAAIGECKVTVTLTSGGASSSGPAVPSAKTQADGMEMQKKMIEMSQKGAASGGQAGGGPPPAKSAIPDRYSKPDSSGLSRTVDKDSSKNQFTIELTE